MHFSLDRNYSKFINLSLFIMKKILQFLAILLSIISVSTTLYSQCFPFPKSNTCHPLLSGMSYGFNDMDGDGIPEMYYGDKKGSIIINKRLNDTYNRIGVIAHEGGNTKGRGIEFYDIDGDFENEAITYRFNGVSVSYKNSLNGYGAAILYPWLGSYIVDHIFSDCNNDGFKELYYISGSNTNNKMYTLKNINGLLGGADSVQLLGTLNYMAIGDINADGYKDIVVSANGTNQGFNILKGGPSGFTTSFYNATNIDYRFTIGDLNGDNYPEIICQYYGSLSGIALKIFQNNGGTTFTALPLVELNQVFPAVDADVLVTDFDDDQLMDVVTSSKDSLIKLKGDGALGFSQIVTFRLLDSGRLLSGDFNGDAKIDFAVMQSNLSLFLGADSIQNDKSKFYSGGAGSISYLFDMDGNGLVDIIEDRWITYQSKRGVFDYSPAWISNQNLISGLGIFAVADFDGDGLGDIIAEDYSVYPYKFRLYTGANGFYIGVAPAYTFPQRYITPRMYPAFLNTDSISDLVVVQQLSGIDSVITYIGTANGTFTLGSRFTSPAYTFLNPIIKDLNNDGKADIVSCSEVANSIRSWKGLGNGFFTVGSNIQQPGNVVPHGITVGNIDNLGNDEVIVSAFNTFSSGDFDIYTVNSNLQLTWNNSLNMTPYNCEEIKLYDFDKDGFLDLKGGASQTVNCYYRGNGSLTGFIDDTTRANPGSYSFPPLYTDPLGYDDFIAYLSEYRPAHKKSLSVDALAPSQACNGKVLTLRSDYTGLSTYSWNTGDTTSSIQVSNDGDYFLTINTSPGCSFNSDTITLNFVNCDSVWPGDSNRDFIVNQEDLFPINLNYNDSGSLRAVVSNVWAPWASSDWSSNYAFNDKKFIDSNGDGAINEMDTIAISQNFSNTYAARSSGEIPVVANTPQLFFVKIQQGVTQGDTIILGLYAGTAGSQFVATSGFSLDISYDGSKVQSGTGTFKFDNNSFLGNRGIDWLSIERISGNSITSSIGVKSGTTVNGYGKVGELSFILNQSLATSYQFTYSIANSSYSGYSGQLLPLDQTSGAITFTTTGLSDITSSSIQILGSNPLRGGQEVMVKADHFKGDLEARWMNMNGQVIDVQSKLVNDNFLLLHAPFTAGIYILQISDGVNRAYTKVVVAVAK